MWLHPTKQPSLENVYFLNTCAGTIHKIETPLDLYLWRTLKNAMYATKPQTLEELRDKIERAINNIPFVIIQMLYIFWEYTVQKLDILNMYRLKGV